MAFNRRGLINLLVILMVVRFGKSFQCLKKGLTCSDDLKNIIYCAGVYYDGLTVDKCPSASLCQTSTKIPRCEVAYVPTDDPNCIGADCAKTIALCSQEGLIPSPYNCRVYFSCKRIGDTLPILEFCPYGAFFDGDINSCSETVQCREPVDCSKSGSYGKIGKKFCYFCDTKNSPFVYPCDD